MKEHCLEIGLIQAFLDSELSLEESSRVASHVAACDACAVALSDAETESSLVFSALDNEYNALVPTQRLWSRINSAIETEKANAPVWSRLRAFVSAALINPSFAAAAGLLIVFGIVSSVWFSGAKSTVTQTSDPTIASAPSQTQRQTPIASIQPAAANPVDAAGSAQPVHSDARPSAARGFEVVRASYTTTDKPRVIANPASLTVPGEESYLRTIESLETTANSQKDSVMRPGERVAYERDMAVVNDSIKKVRDQVRRNPRSGAAKELLYSAYQYKIDLLNSVSQKEELVASLDR